MHAIRYTLPFLAVLALALGCGKDPATSPDASPGSLKLLLTDAPASFDQVNVTFSEVAVNTRPDSGQGGWEVIRSEPLTVDLLSLSNGLTAVLGERELEPGRYGQIRLKLTDAEVVVDGVSHDLDVPSGATSGLKLNGGFTIQPGITTVLVVDFDAARSIHITGKKGGYKLNPVLRLVAQSTSGSISGRVTNPSDMPLAYAISGADTVSSAFVNEITGDFILGFLPAGIYTVSLADTLGQQYSLTGVSVTAGQPIHLGDITLAE